MTYTGLAFEEAALRHYGQLVLEEVVAYLSSIQERPVWQPMPASVRRRLGQQELPMEGIAFEETLAFLRETVLPYPQGNGHPRFAGWINSVPAHASVLLKPLAAALNPNCGIGDHAGQELERCAVRWIMELCAFPPPRAAPDLFAAAAPIAGAGNPSKAALIKDLPIWAFHGSADPVVPVSGSRDMIAALRAAGGHPRYTEFAGVGHGVWGGATSTPWRRVPCASVTFSPGSFLSTGDTDPGLPLLASREDWGL